VGTPEFQETLFRIRMLRIAGIKSCKFQVARRILDKMKLTRVGKNIFEL